MVCGYEECISNQFTSAMCLYSCVNAASVHVYWSVVMLVRTHGLVCMSTRALVCKYECSDM